MSQSSGSDPLLSFRHQSLIPNMLYHIAFLKLSSLHLTDLLALSLLARDLPSGSVVENLPANADVGSVLESGISPGGGNGHPFQYSCLDNSMNRGATVHRVAESDTTEQACMLLARTDWIALS